MAVTWVTYSPDFAQWKWDVLPGRTAGWIRFDLVAVELIPQADVEDARHDGVDSVLGVFVRHELHA